MEIRPYSRAQTDFSLVIKQICNFWVFYSFECVLHAASTDWLYRAIWAICILWSQIHWQWVSNTESNQSCIQYVCSMERFGAELLGIWAGHCTRLEAVVWGHLSAASLHRQTMGTVYPWPMFSFNRDNVLLRLYSFWKWSLYHWWIVFFSFPLRELIVLGSEMVRTEEAGKHYANQVHTMSSDSQQHAAQLDKN